MKNSYLLAIMALSDTHALLLQCKLGNTLPMYFLVLHVYDFLLYYSGNNE